MSKKRTTIQNISKICTNRKCPLRPGCVLYLRVLPFSAREFPPCVQNPRSACNWTFRCFTGSKWSSWRLSGTAFRSVCGIVSAGSSSGHIYTALSPVCWRLLRTIWTWRLGFRLSDLCQEPEALSLICTHATIWSPGKNDATHVNDSKGKVTRFPSTGGFSSPASLEFSVQYLNNEACSSKASAKYRQVHLKLRFFSAAGRWPELVLTSDL